MTLRILAVLLDCGDTLADESTEMKDADGVTQHAQLIPGAREMLVELKRRGYRIALVADGPTATFHNILKQHDIAQFFDAFATSEQVGNDKPHPSMFQRALAELGIPPQDYSHVVMVGNHLGRDVKGANDLGLISVWLDWAPRRAKVPADESEQPRYKIKTPLDLISLLDTLERDQV
jgi:HAD superfamily hydrolase (TIGR01549 family)